MKNSKWKSLALAGWVVVFVLGYGETVHAAEIKGAWSSDMQKFCGQVATSGKTCGQ